MKYFSRFSVYATCAHTEGSFRCACKDGYTPVKGKCVEVDECKAGTHNCDSNAACNNFPAGSWTCACKPGFLPVGPRDGTFGACADINECDRDSANDCGVNARCENNPGAFQCFCNPGYTPTGKALLFGEQCRNINECTNANICGANGKCYDEPGAYRCVCDKGYKNKGGLASSGCADVNECEDTATCPRGDQCVNSEGGHACCTNEDGELKKYLKSAFDTAYDVRSCDAARNFCDDFRIGVFVQWYCPVTCKKCSNYINRGDPGFLVVDNPVVGIAAVTNPPTTTKAPTKLKTQPIAIPFHTDLEYAMTVNGEYSDEAAVSFSIALKRQIEIDIPDADSSVSPDATVNVKRNQVVINVDTADPAGYVAKFRVLLDGQGITVLFRGIKVTTKAPPPTVRAVDIGTTEAPRETQSGFDETQLILIVLAVIIAIALLTCFLCFSTGQRKEEAEIVTPQQEVKEPSHITAKKYLSQPEEGTFVHNGVLVRAPGAAGGQVSPPSPAPAAAWGLPTDAEMSSFAPSQREVDEYARTSALAETRFDGEPEPDVMNVSQATNGTRFTPLPAYDAQKEDNYIEIHGYPGERKGEGQGEDDGPASPDGASAAPVSEADALRQVLNFHALRGTDPLDIRGNNAARGGTIRQKNAPKSDFLHEVNAQQHLVEREGHASAASPQMLDASSVPSFRAGQALPDQSMNTMNPLFNQQDESSQGEAADAAPDDWEATLSGLNTLNTLNTPASPTIVERIGNLSSAAAAANDPLNKPTVSEMQVGSIAARLPESARNSVAEVNASEDPGNHELPGFSDAELAEANAGN